MMLAAHEARPTCPVCGRQVRGGVELQAALAELRETLAAACLAGNENGGYRAMLRAGSAEVAAMAAELAGGHLRCGNGTAARFATVH
jgi:hypothetical protein